MTLREKLNDTIITNIFITESENRMYYEFNHLELAEECEKIADDYAIEFGEWLEILSNSDYNTKENYIYQKFDVTSLLEIFKKEKGL